MKTETKLVKLYWRHLIALIIKFLTNLFFFPTDTMSLLYEVSILTNCFWLLSTDNLGIGLLHLREHWVRSNKDKFCVFSRELPDRSNSDSSVGAGSYEEVRGNFCFTAVAKGLLLATMWLWSQSPSSILWHSAEGDGSEKIKAL